MLFSHSKTEPVSPQQALAGSPDYPYPVPDTHYVNGHPIRPPFPPGLQTAIFGLGCFWGAEEIFWQTEGVWTTAAGYAGGSTPHPTYEQVCTGRTGHTEAVQVVFDPAVLSYAELVARFFEVHDPTQGMRQGNDLGTQYRSAIYYTSDEQRRIAEQARATFDTHLRKLGFGPVTTEIAPAEQGSFYYAEGYHQQYLAKNPNGYRCHATTGITFPR
ncbi:MAG: peptide-methionine (S)-S-oxide reductase MsrA [Jatrophihabitantaceae bacterium]